MKWSDVAVIVLGYGLLLVQCVTLVFIWYQLKYFVTQIRSASLQAIWITWIDIDRWFVQNPGLRKYFYEKNAEMPDDADEDFKSQLQATSEMLLDCYAHIYSQKETMKLLEYGPFRDYMNQVYHDQPVFRRFVDGSSTWYDTHFIGDLRKPLPAAKQP